MSFKVGDEVKVVDASHLYLGLTGTIIEIINGHIGVVQGNFTERLGKDIIKLFLERYELITPTHVCKLICKCNARKAMLL